MPTPYKLKLLNGVLKLKTFSDQVLSILGIKDLGTRTGNVSNGVVDWSIQHFTQTTAAWTADTTTILLDGQIGIENTGTTTYKFKIGNGVDLWSSLGYAGGGSGSSGVTSFNARTGVVVPASGDYTKSDVGLGNVDNTSDLNKPISTATQTALNNKEPLKGTDDNYVTDAQLVVISNTSGTNSGNETTSTIGTLINGAADATPNDTDLVATAESSVLKKITWTNVKAFLKTYFDTLYATASALANKTDKGDIGITSFRNATFNPADSSTIYLRITNNLAPSTTTGNACAIVPFACSNIVITLDALTTGTAGTNENITVKLINVTQVTEETISTTYQMGGTTNSQALTSTLSFAANDFVAVCLTFPVFATNPTGVYFHAHLTFTK